MKTITFEVEVSALDDLPSSKSPSYLADLMEETLTEVLSDNGIDSEVTVREVE